MEEIGGALLSLKNAKDRLEVAEANIKAVQLYMERELEDSDSEESLKIREKYKGRILEKKESLSDRIEECMLNAVSYIQAYSTYEEEWFCDIDTLEIVSKLFTKLPDDWSSLTEIQDMFRETVTDVFSSNPLVCGYEVKNNTIIPVLQMNEDDNAEWISNCVDALMGYLTELHLLKERHRAFGYTIPVSVQTDSGLEKRASIVTIGINDWRIHSSEEDTFGERYEDLDTALIEFLEQSVLSS